MKPLKQRVSITLDYDVIEKIKKDDRSFSQYINLIVRKYLQTLEGEKKE